MKVFKKYERVSTDLTIAIEEELDGENPEFRTGGVEDIERSTERNRKAIAKLLTLLVEKNVLTLDEVANVAGIFSLEPDTSEDDSE